MDEPSYRQQTLFRLIDAGFSEEQAKELAPVFERLSLVEPPFIDSSTTEAPREWRGPDRERPPDTAVMRWAVGLGFVFVLAAMGWLLSEISENGKRIETVRELVAAETSKNRDRIDDVGKELARTNTGLARIETLLQERLPSKTPAQ